MELKAHPSIAIAGCISTTALSQTLVVELDKAVLGKGRVFNFVVEILVGADKHKKRLHVLDELPSVSGLQDVATVSGIFDTLRGYYDYEHILLTTLDHGSGFAIFAPPDDQPRLYSLAHRFKQKKRRVVRHITPKKRHTIAAIRAAVLKSTRDSEPSGLTMDKLHQAIHRTFGKVDVIFMRNCFMQMFDTGYTLRKVTRYLVAFESLMWFPAFNYAIWFKAMQEEGSLLTPEEVVTGAIRGFRRTRMLERFRTDSAVFGNELSFYPQLNDLMNTMIEELIRELRGNKAKILACRNRIIDLVHKDYKGADYQLVDARFWFEQAGKLLQKNKKYQEALANFLVVHTQMIGKRQFVGKLLAGGRYRESGFSLYFPNSPEKIARDGSFYSLYYAAQSPTRSEFSHQSLWPGFIAYLFLDIKPSLLRQPAAAQKSSAHQKALPAKASA